MDSLGLLMYTLHAVAVDHERIVQDVLVAVVVEACDVMVEATVKYEVLGMHLPSTLVAFVGN